MTVKRKNKVLTLEILHQNHECSFARNLKFNMGLSNDAMIYMCVYVCVIYMHIYKFYLKALYSMKVLFIDYFLVDQHIDDDAPYGTLFLLPLPEE